MVGIFVVLCCLFASLRAIFVALLALVVLATRVAVAKPTPPLVDPLGEQPTKLSLEDGEAEIIAKAKLCRTC